MPAPSNFPSHFRGCLLRYLPVIMAVAAAIMLPANAGPRLNQIQVIGTHNSYHIAPHPAVEALTRKAGDDVADSLQYTHRPLETQLDQLGIRQLELDVYVDPEGGLYADPAGGRLADAQRWGAVPLPHRDQLRLPGTKILHVPDFDFQTTVPTLRDALIQIDRWSTGNPAHVPILILLELKSNAPAAGYTQPIPWTADRIESLEREILEVLPPTRILRPDDVRRGKPNLRQAILELGWPELADTRGRILLALDNTDATRDAYLQRSPLLEGRLLFPSVAENHPSAAWFKINDPIAESDRIQRLVREGFLVRTRADAETQEARRNDSSRQRAALASGAQFVSTDYPEPNLSWSSYALRWDNGVVARPNPVSAASYPPDLDLEGLALRGLEPFAGAELAHLNRRAVNHHQRRRLADASRDYERLIELDPPRVPNDAEWERILRHAPELLVHTREPFPLKDVVVIAHPGGRWLGYHLFWEDDIDFPEDNDPTDHEIIWVELDPSGKESRAIQTYFHGEVLVAPSAEIPPTVGIEWGKHGSLPLTGGSLHLDVPVLRRHWETLHRQGIRLPNHPLAARWPKRFEGDWDSYRKFTARVSTRTHLEKNRLAWVGHWANAILDHFALPYNFAPKYDFPDIALESR